MGIPFFERIYIELKIEELALGEKEISY